MPTTRQRMLDSAHKPDEAAILAALGPKASKNWQHLTGVIERAYQSPFTMIFFSKGGGWARKYAIKKRLLCYLLPETGGFLCTFAFGSREQENLKPVFETLSPEARKLYEQAPEYPEGKFMKIPVTKKQHIDDILLFLSCKNIPGRSRRTGGKQ